MLVLLLVLLQRSVLRRYALACALVLLVRVLLLLLLLGLHRVSWRGIRGLLGSEVRRRRASHHERLRCGLVRHGRRGRLAPSEQRLRGRGMAWC